MSYPLSHRPLDIIFYQGVRALAYKQISAKSMQRIVGMWNIILALPINILTLLELAYWVRGFGDSDKDKKRPEKEKRQMDSEG